MEEKAKISMEHRAPRGTYSTLECGPGIYIITNMVNGKRYIGSARCMRDRFAIHRRDLRLGRHHSPKLQRSWNKHGADAFTFQPILSCEPENLLMYEQIALDHYRSQEIGYNILPIAGNRSGFKHSAETRAKMSAKHKGKVMSEASRAKMSARMQGHSPSEETRKKIGMAATGRKPSEETLKKMRGRTVLQETKDRIAAKLKLYHASKKMMSPSGQGDHHD